MVTTLIEVILVLLTCRCAFSCLRMCRRGRTDSTAWQAGSVPLLDSQDLPLSRWVELMEHQRRREHRRQNLEGLCSTCFWLLVLFLVFVLLAVVLEWALLTSGLKDTMVR